MMQPQPGPQYEFFCTEADIAIYGGAAGGGKSWALLVEPLRHKERNPHFGAVIFRRESTQVFNEGGLWDEATEIYSGCGAWSNRTSATFTFPYPGRKRGGMSVSFKHIQLESDVQAYQGAQIPLIGFDELTHFTAKQFWYMVSRNRSTCGVRPYIRATTNPDPDSWVAELVAWWIDQREFEADGVTPNSQYGFPIPERAGVLRYFVREKGEFIWGDSREEVMERLLAANPAAEQSLGDIKSLTFIPARLEDNKILMEKDPGYRGNLMALDPVERAQLLGGNWKARLIQGLLFKRDWVEFVTEVPRVAKRIRYWDRAATEPTRQNPDPDWTVGVLMAITPDGLVYVEDVVRVRGTPRVVEQTVLATAELDRATYGLDVSIGIEQDPGSAGKTEAANYVRLLAGYAVRVYPVTKDKVTRFKPFSAQAEARNVRLKRGEWNAAYISTLEAFPSKTTHDDDVDATAGAYNALVLAPLEKSEKPAATAQDVLATQQAFLRRLGRR